MTDAPTVLEINCTTGEHIERPMTAEEIQQRELDAIAYATQQAELEVAKQAKEQLKASAKAKLIAGQPLTAEEADTLVI